MCSNTFYKSNMDAGSSLRWLSPSTMTLCQYIDSTSTSDPVPQNLSQVWCVWMFKASAVCPWTAYQCAQTHCMLLVWMQEAVWGGSQPQQWYYTIILTPQVTTNPKISCVVWQATQLPNCNRHPPLPVKGTQPIAPTLRPDQREGGVGLACPVVTVA